MCLTALAFNRLKPSIDWSKADLDEVLNKGDHLYFETMSDIQEMEQQEKEPETTEETIVQNEMSKEQNDGSGDSLPSQSFRIKTDNVKKEFNIGLNKFEIEFEDIEQGKRYLCTLHSKFMILYNLLLKLID